MKRLVIVTWLTAFWVILWGDPDLGTALAGLVAAIAVTVIFPPEIGDGTKGRLRLHWMAAFLGYFTWKLVEANVVLAIEILTPRDYTRSGVIGVSVEGASDLVVTLVANAITLTPGTLTLEVRRDPRILYIHVLHLRDTERVRRDVHRLQDLALRSIGSAAALRHHRQATEGSDG